VTIGEERLAAATIVWGAGVMASAAAQWLGVAKDRAGRVVVGPDLTVAGYPEISCIGDTACAVGAAGKPLPGPAPVAKQQGALGWVKLDGTLAWLLWSAVHVSFLIGFRNRLVVMLDWLWSYFTFQSGARLITGPGSH
jgi:NADH dehydrogenase